jgi:hypothetical protein
VEETECSVLLVSHIVKPNSIWLNLLLNRHDKINYHMYFHHSFSLSPAFVNCRKRGKEIFGECRMKINRRNNYFNKVK